MSATTGKTYLSTPEALSLREVFAANVEKAMQAKRWTLQDLTRESNIPRRTVESLLYSHHQPTLVGAAAVARALGQPLDVMLGQPPSTFLAPSAEGEPTRIECIHVTAHRPDMPVCEACFAAWQRFQTKKRELAAGNRTDQREGWLAENATVRQQQLAQAGLDKDTDER